MSIYERMILPNPGIGSEKLRKFDDDLIRALNQLDQTLNALLNMGLGPDNMDASLVTVVSHVTPGTEFSIAHQLGKVPTGYKVYGQSGAGSVYDGTTANDKTTLYLRSDVSAITFKLIVF